MLHLQIHTRTQRGAMLAVGRAASVTPEGGTLGIPGEEKHDE